MSSTGMATRTSPSALIVRRMLPVTQLSAALNALPSTLKWLAIFLVLLNVRSFPLAWHIRVFSPAIKLHIQYRWLLLKLFMSFRSRKQKAVAVQEWLDTLSPVGVHPFKLKITHKSWAGPDDSDYNFHLSNSCYPKLLDQVRLRAALKMCPSFFRHGGWMALAATHHHFIREIPIFANFEVRMGIGAWDEKWIYILIRFVTPPKKRSSKKQVHSPASGSVVPTISTPANPVETDVNTPSPAATPPRTAALDAPSSASAAALASKLAVMPESDGATLHCVAVSVMCFKMGRITVPPAIVLATEGLTRSPTPADIKAGVAVEEFSAKNPPPSWTAHAQRLRSQACSKEYQTFVKGAWREVPEGQRWWDDALGGDVEPQRQERLKTLNVFREGMEGARGLVL